MSKYQRIEIDENKPKKKLLKLKLFLALNDLNKIKIKNNKIKYLKGKYP